MMAVEFRKRACQAEHRLSKASFLAMLGDPAVAPATVSDSTARAFYEKLNDVDWVIVSFNSNSREVCIDITTDSGIRRTSNILPTLSASKPASF